MVKRTGLLLLATLLAFSVMLNSCDTDVDLIAPYKTVPVIVGVLDHAVDTQFFRINRTFLGEGDANLFAGIKDSVEYPDGTVEAWIIKYQAPNASSTNIDSWTKLDSILLQPIDIPSRSPGVFYQTNVRYYYTAQPIFTASQITNIANMRYQLRANLNGRTVTGVTNFPTINQGNINYPSASPIPIRLPFYSPQSMTYLNVNFQYVMNSGTVRYEGVLRLNFNADMTDGSTLTNQYIDYNLGSNSNPEGINDERNFTFNSENWYEFVGLRLGEIEGLKKVRVQDVQFRLTGGNQELDTYINVAQPVSEFVPVLNTYTNLSNEAIGIFASKTQIARTAYLDEPTMGQLAFGPYTEGPCYCVTWVVGTAFNCSASPDTCP